MCQGEVLHAEGGAHVKAHRCICRWEELSGDGQCGCDSMSGCSVFFFSSRRRHTRCSRDWSSDVCSSDLFVENAISITREAEVKKMDIGKQVMISHALAGPKARLASEHVMSCYVIWKFAQNKEGAQQFLVDFIDSFHDAFKASGFYNFPCFPSTAPNLKEEISNDPKADPPDKYKVLSDVLDWATTVGHPGYATAAGYEVFNTFVIPTMFAKVARDQETPENAAAAAEKEVKRIFDKWKTA